MVSDISGTKLRFTLSCASRLCVSAQDSDANLPARKSLI